MWYPDRVQGARFNWRVKRDAGENPARLRHCEPVALVAVVRSCATETDFILIDCLTLWLSNLLFEWRENNPESIERRACEQARELAATSKQGSVVAVTNEVGSGTVPESSVARLFRDIQGLVNQQMAHSADAVHFLSSGIPTQIKPSIGGQV